MPQQRLTNPPPNRPVDDEDAVELRTLALLCDQWRAALGTNQQVQVQPTPIVKDRIAKVFGQYQSKEQNKAWTLHDSHSFHGLAQKVEGDLTYFKGDIIRILDAKGRWILGVCRGRLGITCLDHLEFDGFVRALYDFAATQDDEISFRKGQVFPAIPSSYEGWLYGFKADEEGLIPGNYVEPANTPFSQRYGPDCHQYGPLKDGEIRLIYFSEDDAQRTQACSGDTTFLSLITVRLDVAPAFTALSYCWGDAKRLETVFCDGKPLRVTPNLATLLRWFAKDKSKPEESASADTSEPDPTRYIWADAICINQNNMAEKEHQVPYMRAIYGTAQHVKVYLGESADVWNVLLSFALVDQIIRDSSFFLTRPPAEVQENLAKVDLTALSKFFANPAFHRSWMIQEMVLGKDVALWYGEAQVDLATISRYIQFQDATNLSFANTEGITLTSAQMKDAALGTYHADNLGKVQRMWHLGQPKSFIEVLRRFRGAKATDLRDKVYSLLGLAGDHYFNTIVPNYSTSNTAADVFIQVANLAVTSPNKDDVTMLLDNAGLHVAESTVGHDLPSWVPDWTVLPCPPIDPAFYSCSGPTSVSVRVTGPNTACRAITVTGAVVDKTGFLGPEWLSHNEDQPLPAFPTVDSSFAASIVVHETLYLISQRLIAADKSYPVSNTTYEDAVWQTLVCGRGWGQRRAQPEDKRYYDAFLKTLGIEAPAASQEAPAQPENGHDYPFRLLINQFHRGRRVGMTRKGYFGTFPNQTMTGDVVALLLGLKMPFVLRPQPGDGEGCVTNYQLVGPCYVHGIMDGELVTVETQDGVEQVHVKGASLQEFLVV